MRATPFPFSNALAWLDSAINGRRRPETTVTTWP
jgi:hypothetical protein